MYEAKVNDSENFLLSLEGDHLALSGAATQPEFKADGAHSFQVLHNGKNFRVHVLNVDMEAQTVVLKVNGKRAEVKLSTELDRLLQQMGLNAKAGGKAGNMKAPMPGLIHSILVTEGQQVQKGDALLILEAMKMENVLKAGADGVVGKVHVQKGANVDKGAMLISFG